ncbi:MAG: substrate-binding domain-containing protein, partial [Candidatus Tectomicrobia bacterium]|nr:substrate-binding domain-containing protein [Candidatus Tectomicrobia bacterium]
EKKHGAAVDVIAVGTGQALRLGQNGDVDVVLVHARAAEDKFVADGHGVGRRGVMYNDFIVAGPAKDPAEIRGMKDAAAALRKIEEKKALWFSRGDDSGTHKMELQLWKAAGLAKPAGGWYRALGQGMGNTLIAADEKGAYTLADRGTYIALTAKKKIALEVTIEGDQRLFNPYGAIAVNPKRHPHVKHDLAMKYIGFLVSPEGQKLIGGFRMGGKVLFFPSAGKAPGG